MKNIKYIEIFVTIVYTENGSRNEGFMTEETKPIEPTVQPTEPTQPTEPAKPTEPFKSFLTQEDFDNETAKIRGNAERKTKAELLKALGIDSEDKLEVIKKAYENSLTEQEKVNEQLKQLDILKAELNESKAIITALSKLSNKPNDEVIKIVKMAKGLVSDDVTIEQALEEVMKLLQIQKPQVPTSTVIVTTPEPNPNTGEKNPFKENNMTEMGKLIKENPAKARELAKLANYPVNW